MEHRIQFSSQLLITVKSAARRQKITKPPVTGIRIDVNPASLQQKSSSLVDALGNIIPAGSREVIAA